ncbi:MAG: hypothetical protein IT275_10175 [Chitinophagales bacterium]|nr:hypothetical protein [Chitinophagales bacterium]
MAQVIDRQIVDYLPLLGKEEKKTILDFIKSHIKIKDKPERISIEQYNKELEAAEARIDAGEFYTQEEIENMIK